MSSNPILKTLKVALGAVVETGEKVKSLVQKTFSKEVGDRLGEKGGKAIEDAKKIGKQIADFAQENSKKALDFAQESGKKALDYVKEGLHAVKEATAPDDDSDLIENKDSFSEGAEESKETDVQKPAEKSGRPFADASDSAQAFPEDSDPAAFDEKPFASYSIPDDESIDRLEASLDDVNKALEKISTELEKIKCSIFDNEGKNK